MLDNHSVKKPRWMLAFALAAMVSAVAGCSDDDNKSGNSTQAVAGINRIVIDSSTSENPTFEGKSFGDAGPYEKVRGIAYGQLDPKDPRNKVITDLDLAPVNAQGMVEYSTDFYILKPVDLSRGNHKVFLESVNRGNKTYGRFNESSGGNNPTIADDAGNAFLENLGYTLVWVGWEPAAARTDDKMGISVPIAKNPDGSTITGPDYEYIEFDNSTSTSYTTAYDTSTTDTSEATLTVKDHLTDAPTTVPPTGWAWTSDNTISLLPAGTPFKQSAIYELTFTAKDPWVGGIGFAAIRDFVSFIRNAQNDTGGTPSPLAGDVTRVVSWTLSQPARLMNDYIWLGFNQDVQGNQVFDGVFNWVGAGTGIALNYRFEQSGRTERARQNHLYPEGTFPFSYTTLTDPFTGKTDGRDKRCMETKTCPKIMNVNSANEYWVKTGSLLHTDLEGNDLADPANVRNYLISGTQHAGPGGVNSLGTCQQFANSTDQNPALRALWEDLDQWLDGTPPPPSMVPRRSDGTGVFSETTANSPLGIGTVPQADLGWPDIPEVLYTGVTTVRNRFNFGPNFDEGILSINPPQATGDVYPAFVSAVDSDGNEIAGVELPPVSAPVATTAGWNLRSAAYGGNDSCEGTGSLIPFAPTEAARTNIGDPRPSLDSRYTDHAGYVAAVTAAAENLEKKRLLLPADVQAYIDAAQEPINVVDNPVYGSYTW